VKVGFMRTAIRFALAGALIAASCAAYAQQPQTSRIRGQIQAVDGSVLTIKSGEANATVKLADNASVYGVVKATLADVKPGAFIGVGAIPQADGSQRAVQVMIFSEPQRGTVRATVRGTGRTAP
jgi:hypothetical protein